MSKHIGEKSVDELKADYFNNLHSKESALPYAVSSLLVAPLAGALYGLASRPVGGPESLIEAGTIAALGAAVGVACSAGLWVYSRFKSRKLKEIVEEKTGEELPDFYPFYDPG